jgi:hypothetical protein
MDGEPEEAHISGNCCELQKTDKVKHFFGSSIAQKGCMNKWLVRFTKKLQRQ